MTTFPNSSASPQSGEAATPDSCVVLEVGFIPWDNPDNLVSQTTERVVDTAVGAVCLPLLFVLSVPCNLLNMLVFCRQGLAERINLCLFSLSLVDLLHMVTNFMLNVDRLFRPFTHTYDHGPVSRFLIDNHLPGFRAFFPWMSGFISMLIACERCLCVVSPLRSQTVLKTRTTAVILACACLVILSGSFVIGLRWQLACIFDPATNTTSTVFYTSEFYTRNKAHMDILSFFVLTLQPVVYVTIVSATTAVTSLKLKRMVAWRQQTSSASLSSREVALTRTLIVVSIIYIVCFIPPLLAGICVRFVAGTSLRGRRYNLGNLVSTFFMITSYINASLNFFVYCFLGSKFKETLREVFQCVSVGHRSATTSGKSRTNSS